MNHKSKKKEFEDKIKYLMNDQAFTDYQRTLNSMNSQQSVYYAVKSFVEYLLLVDDEFTWDCITDVVVNKAIAKMLNKQQAPTTINTKLCALKGVAIRLWVQGRIDGKEYQLISDIKNVRGSRLSHGRMLTDDEVEHLFDYVNSQNKLCQVRDAAIFAVMVGTGLRWAEVAKLSVDNLHLDESQPFMRVIGKGNKERQLPLPKLTQHYLKQWLDVKGTKKGLLFVQILKNETITEKALSGCSIYNICQNYVKKANMKGWTPHDLRRTCASKIISMGADLTTARDFLGHTSIATTQLYDKRSLKRLEDVAKNIKF